ncbi:MAG: hypothetical protein SGARI_003639 [Bacillariaceae sp.]
MTRQTGTVAKWLNHRGIGFITPDGAESEIGKDLLVHHSHIKQNSDDSNSFKTLQTGSTVEFEMAQDPKNPDKQIAINVTGVGGGDCERAVHGNWRQLKDLMKQVGYVDWVETSRDNTTGEVHFSSAEDANKAVSEYNGYTLEGSDIVVSLTK